MVVQALKEIGPCLSTTLAKHLIETRGLSPTAARQRISRAPKDDVRKLSGLPFANGARFVYLREQYSTGLYWENLFEAIQSEEGPYARAISCVLARQIIPVDHFHIACGSPVRQKKQLCSDAVLRRLIETGILVEQDIPGIGPCVMTRELDTSYERENAKTATRSRLMVEAFLLGCIRDWLRNLALASYEKVTVRGGPQSQPPRVATFNWDLSAPSYCTALADRHRGGAKPGFIACDVLLTDSVSIDAIWPFLHKMRSIQALKNVGRVMFIMVGQRFESDAFAELRSAGAIPATPESLFGKEIAQTFRDLMKILEDAIQGVVDSERLDDAVTKLSKVPGDWGNMRGSLFELLVAEVVRKTFPGLVEVNYICDGDDGKAEVDVWAVRDGIEARLIECKGMAPGALVSDDEIDLWLTKRINRVRQHLTNRRHWKGPKPSFELWTSGVLSPEALDRIERTREANKTKFELVVFGPEEIREKARVDAPLLKTLEHHFIPRK